MNERSVNTFKGKKNTVLFNRVHFVVHFLVLILLIGKLSGLTRVVKSDYRLNGENVSAAVTLSDYYAFPIVRGAQPIDDGNQLQYNELLDTFYEETKEQYRPVLMDCTNYMSYAGEKTLAQQYNQLPVTVNEYYLEINPIRDGGGNVIDASYFKEGALNILVPDTMEISGVIDSQFAYYKSQGYEFNGIYYRAGETIRAFSPFVGENGNGRIEDPVIIIYDSELIWGQMLNYVSGMHIFFYLPAENPYEQIVPDLERYGLNKIMLTAEPISNVYDNSISHVNKELKNAFWELGILLPLFVFMVYNGCSGYIRVNERKLAVKKRHGYGAWDLNGPPAASIAARYGVLALLTPVFHFSVIAVLGAFAVHLVIETICFHYLIVKGVGK